MATLFGHSLTERGSLLLFPEPRPSGSDRASLIQPQRHTRTDVGSSLPDATQ